LQLFAGQCSIPDFFLQYIGHIDDAFLILHTDIDIGIQVQFGCLQPHNGFPEEDIGANAEQVLFFAEICTQPVYLEAADHQYGNHH